jgi:hypothetical protein
VANYNGKHNVMSQSHSPEKLRGHTHMSNSDVAQDTDVSGEDASTGYGSMSRQMLFAAVLLGTMAMYLISSNVGECTVSVQNETIGAQRKQRSLVEQEHTDWTMGAPADLESARNENTHQSFMRRTAAQAQEMEDKRIPYGV